MNPYNIPRPDDLFKNDNEVDQEQVDYFVTEISRAIKTIKHRHQYCTFEVPKSHVKLLTMIEVTKIFDEQGWEIKWDHYPTVQAKR